MAATKGSSERSMQESDALIMGVLALLVDNRERSIADDKNAVKTETLLSTAGMSVEDITAVTGKKKDTVRKTIQRGKDK